MPVTDHFDWEQRLHGRVLDCIDVLYQIVMKKTFSPSLQLLMDMLTRSDFIWQRLDVLHIAIWVTVEVSSAEFGFKVKWFAVGLLEEI